jgi:hypothetical protein
MMGQTRIIIFAKAPMAGFAKTRLVPRLGAQGAAEVARKLLCHTLNTALGAPSVDVVELCVTPNHSETLWQTYDVPHGPIWSDQGDGDLGARLLRATKRGLENDTNVLLIGTDCPALDAAHLARAVDALKSTDAVMIPAHDGGYVLLGLRRFTARVFEHMPWSTADVAQITRERLSAQGFSLTTLPALYDIDAPDDLIHLPEGF